MPYYSVQVQGEDARPVASDLKATFRGKIADYTGHPIFFVENHRNTADFRKTVEAMLPAGHEVIIKRISKAAFNWNVPKRK